MEKEGNRGSGKEYQSKFIAESFEDTSEETAEYTSEGISAGTSEYTSEGTFEDKSEDTSRGEEAQKTGGYMLNKRGLSRELKLMAILLVLFFLPVILDYLQVDTGLYKTGLLLGAVVNLYYVLNYLLLIKTGITNRYFLYVRILLNLIVIAVPALTGRISSAPGLLSYLGGLLTGDLAVLLLFYSWVRSYSKDG